VLQVRLGEVAEGCEVDVDALILYHLDGSDASLCVWTMLMVGGSRDGSAVWWKS
jgi:hypothetical protein